MQTDFLFKSYTDALAYSSTFAFGLWKYLNEFMEPSFHSQKAFFEVKRDQPEQQCQEEDNLGLLHLLQFNNELAYRSARGALEATVEYQRRFSREVLDAWGNTISEKEGEDLASFFERKQRSVDMVVNQLPQAVKDIKAEYGFHFDNGGYVRIDETERFILYQVLPLEKKVKTRPDGKPVLIIPPYVLGPNILALLPGERRSYVHSFADQGIPTYIRIVKDIHQHTEVQTMTGEDDTLDTKHFCELLKKKHKHEVTLNGFCQGGFIAICSLLSGELDNLVDALITCVAPMDGTRSPSFVEYLEQIPYDYRDLEYSMKTLANGNRVIDGKIMSWVYRLKSIEAENPFSSFCRDLAMYDQNLEDGQSIPKITAAINHWLTCDRTDLPVEITKMSYASYIEPVDKDGNLPVKLFGRTLNFKRIKEKNIHFLIAYAQNDDLITKETAMAPLDHIPAEVTIYPKGHGGIATSWSVPTSKCAHHTYFLGESGRRKHRGVVRYHLDLEAGIIQPEERRETSERREERIFMPYDTEEAKQDQGGGQE